MPEKITPCQYSDCKWFWEAAVPTSPVLVMSDTTAKMLYCLRCHHFEQHDLYVKKETPQ
jgi:hypothetical protein